MTQTPPLVLKLTLTSLMLWWNRQTPPLFINTDYFPSIFYFWLVSWIPLSPSDRKQPPSKTANNKPWPLFTISSSFHSKVVLFLFIVDKVFLYQPLLSLLISCGEKDNALKMLFNFNIMRRMLALPNMGTISEKSSKCKFKCKC